MQDGKRSGLRRRIIWSAAIAIVVVVLALGVYDAVTLPGCASCHDQDGFRTATAAAPHAEIDCRSCHVPPGWIGRLAFVLRQPLHMFVPVLTGSNRDAAAVPDSRCLACHKDVRDRVVTADGLRISHGSCAAGSSCSDCHSLTAHGQATPWLRVYEMDRCLSCHISKGKTDCELCHKGRDRTNAIESPTFAVTHGSQWRSTHGMGDGETCTVCHRPDDCVECHGAGLPHGPDFVSSHADLSAKEDAKCTSCHTESFCDACHGTPMPHSPRFTADHPKTAAAKPEICRRCHAGSDCTTCHEKHVHPGGAIGGVKPTMGGGR